MPCQCGCGLPTKIAKITRTARGQLRGQPVHFLRGHAGGVRVRKYSQRHSVEYKSYHDAKQRCTNPKSHKWPQYGARGIEFRFQSYGEFFKVLGNRPSPEYSLDRINNEGHYEAGNVRWATRSQQMSNQQRSNP